ncbi:hypothetical protein KPL70_004424 [Citrus sinensis]|nr:hypothetical protein KPL70_004424 [Citrus sinensis]
MGAEKRRLFTLFSAALLSLLLLLLYSFSTFTSSRPFPSVIHHGAHYPPAFAYYISGGTGDKDRIFRLLLALYHPRNRYLLHLAADASDDERLKLAAAVRSVPAVRAFGNVDVVGKPDRVNFVGSSNVAAVLRAAAILLKVDKGWNWFIALSALDYPLITQDDLAHAFSSVRRDLNFIDHTSDLGWKESQRIQPVIVDPGLYLARKSQIFQATEKRPTPDAFKVALKGVLALQVHSVYFHSVICNAPEFKNTTINSDLRYMIWDNPPKMEPHFLNVSDYDQMVQSGVVFARQFQKDDPVLNMIDEKILKRGHNRVAPGAWCTGQRSWWMDPCTQWGDVNVLKPGQQATKLEDTITNLLDDWSSQSNQCK